MKIEIGYNTELYAGDVVEFHFKTWGMVWIQAAQIALIEKRLRDDPRFEILNTEVVNKSKVIVTLVVLDQKSGSW